MEMESNGEMNWSRFREELNEWFRERGIVDNLRSHLRSLMIAALQRREINLKSHRKISPKVQSIDLMVAEYLLRHGCHYTLSILTSELPSLANFGTGAFFGADAGKTGPKSDRRFREKEVLEILNCLRLPCDSPKYVWSCYNEKKNEGSLLECLLGSLTSLTFRENSNGQAVEEENFKKRAKDLAEREKRIQECLKSHEEEVLTRLKMAEKDLDERRESIEKELTERQIDLGRIAFRWRNKHEEMMSLSKLFAALKKENKSLREKLDAAEEEMNKLKSEMEVKREALERARDENLKFKLSMEEYLKLKNKSVRDESQSNAVRPKMSMLNGKYFPGTLKNGTERDLNSEENSSSSSEIFSLTEDAVLERVKARVRALEEETGMINEKYLTSKKKYEDDLSLGSEITGGVENRNSETSDVPKEMNPEEDARTPEKEPNRNFVIANELSVEPESRVKKKTILVRNEGENLVPTKRQEKNREYYLESRHLLEILEKNTGIGGRTSTSSTETSLRFSCSSESSSFKIGGHVRDLHPTVQVSEDSEHVSVSERLNLLREAARIANGTRDVEVPEIILKFKW